jgi:hypothetical protein
MSDRMRHFSPRRAGSRRSQRRSGRALVLQALRSGAALLVAMTAMYATAVHADPSPAAQAEIDHLLAFVAASPCTFIRNGTPYPAAEARDHLAGKLRFAGGRISTAEEFVRYLATESSMSHEPYKVKCAAKEMPAGVWLSEELKRYRAVAARPAS